MKPYVLAALFCFLCLVELSFGCTWKAKYLSKFDETEFIFIGTVRGYTGPYESAKLRSKAFGLVVDVKESVHLPKTPKANFEVFPIRLGSDCSFSGETLEQLKQYFSVGSEIRVIAKEAKYISGAGSEDVINLELGPGDSGQLSRNRDLEGQSMTSAKSIFDYKSFSFDPDKDSWEKLRLRSFEARKDLYRLWSAPTQMEKNAVLDRLTGSKYIGIDFFEVSRTYTANEIDAERYFEKHLQIVDPIFSAHYPAYKYSSDELLRQGYERRSVVGVLRRIIRESKKPLPKELMLRKAIRYLIEKQRLSGK